MTEKILIPLDGSKTGESALRYVDHFMSRLEPREMPEIMLFRVIKPKVHYFPVERGVMDINDNIKDTEKEKNWLLTILKIQARNSKKRDSQ